MFHFAFYVLIDLKTAGKYFNPGQEVHTTHDKPYSAIIAIFFSMRREPKPLIVSLNIQNS